MTKQHLFNTTVVPTWCPGCGNFGTWLAVKNALNELEIPPQKVLTIFDIGCGGNGNNFWGTNTFHGLHGRPLPLAVGAKIANSDLVVLVSTGDGGGYGEGGNHFIHTVRSNIQVVCLAHNNQLYGLTTGQFSPMSDQGFVSKTSPEGVTDVPFNPLATAISNGGTFAARGFSGDLPHLTNLIKQAIQHPGFALVDILQPCVTFNKINTFAWYKERIYKLEDKNHKTNDKKAAWEKAMEQDDKIPIGIFYKEIRSTYHDLVPALINRALAKQELTAVEIEQFLEEFK